ncbi:hypothetical protein CM1200mP19_1150 [bacterium]|nr:MAG: hypothetical protein CM1200mP19_1150 [bacterium]
MLGAVVVLVRSWCWVRSWWWVRSWCWVRSWWLVPGVVLGAVVVVGAVVVLGAVVVAVPIVVVGTDRGRWNGQIRTAAAGRNREHDREVHGRRPHGLSLPPCPPEGGAISSTGWPPPSRFGSNSRTVDDLFPVLVDRLDGSV